MNTSMITASVSMGQLQKQIDTIGHNLANQDTNGYKGREVQFSSLLAQQVDNLPEGKDGEGRLTPDGIRVGYGARVGETNMNLKPGELKHTDRDLDLATAEPSHFFQVESTDDNGFRVRAFTRDGAFSLQPDAANPNVRNLVTNDGDFVLGTNGHIQIPAQFDHITVNNQGDISVNLPNGQTTNPGRLAMADIHRPQIMKSLGDNQITLPDLGKLNLDEQDILQDVNAGTASVKQGFLETSNVDPMQEMTQLTQAQRSYQLNARAISIADETMDLINRIR